MIRYLDKEEREDTRALYEECFPEDSGSFVDYYYREKIRDNQILVMEQQGRGRAGAGRFQVMLHLNPFLFRFGEEVQQLNYIVAVATAMEARRQGKMLRVMKQALQDMAAQGQPFTFLIPANPRVYESSGFAFVPEQEGKDLTPGHRWEAGQGRGGSSLQVCPAGAEDIPRLVECSNQWLAGQYDIFPLRSREYVSRFFQELRAQDGAVLAVTDAEGQLAGIAAYGREEERGELQQLLARPGMDRAAEEAVRAYLAQDGVLELKKTEMPFMVRILELSRLMALWGSICREDFCLRVRLEDQILPANNGCYELYCQKGTGGLRAIPEGKAEVGMDVAGLARELFGRVRLYIREWV